MMMGGLRHLDPVDRIKAFMETPRSNDELYMELIATQDHFKLSQDEMLWFVSCASRTWLFNRCSTHVLYLSCHRLSLIFEAFFYESTMIFETAREKAGLLKRFATSENAPKIILRYLELLVDRSGSEVYLEAAPLIMKLFYDTDVLEEDSILEWAAKRSHRNNAQRLRAVVAPFVAWLDQAEEESGSSDEDEDEDAVEDSEEEYGFEGGEQEDEGDEDYFG